MSDSLNPIFLPYYCTSQEASVSIWLQFNDDTAILVSAFISVPHSLRLSSLAESVVAVTPEPMQRILAQGEGGGPLVKAELLVSTCEPLSNDVEANVVRDGGGTRRLAKGSGWIRVNLDSEVWPVGSNSDPDMFDVSDMLLESDKDFYGNFGDKVIIGNITSDFTANGGDGLITRNDLERAVLTPNHQESAVYFSPGIGREKEQSAGDRDLEVGLGAVLSLLCLSALLFLANCLPCALRERKKRRMREKEVQGPQGLHKGIEVEEDEGEEKEDNKMDDQVARLKNKVKFCKGDKIHTVHTDIKPRD